MIIVGSPHWRKSSERWRAEILKPRLTQPRHPTRVKAPAREEAMRGPRVTGVSSNDTRQIDRIDRLRAGFLRPEGSAAEQ